MTTAHWLVQMGWEVYAHEGGIAGDGTETGMPAPTLASALGSRRPAKRWRQDWRRASFPADTDVNEDT